MDKLKSYSIYRIDEINYIGSTCDIKQRKINHEYYKQIKCELNVLVHVFMGDSARRMVEQYFINKYDSINNGSNVSFAYGWNLKGHKENNQHRYKIYKQLGKCRIWGNNHYNKNKKKINKRHKEYRNKNKEKINARRNEKIKCPNCNTLISRRNKSRHKKSKSCKNYVVV